MFTQTKKHPVGEFDRAIEAVGGNSNAMTYYDFTAYMTTCRPASWRVAARLEADRMVNLELASARSTTSATSSSRSGSAAVEDSVDGVLDEMMYKQAFKTHPYRWPVIGWMKDIKAVTRDKAVAFYRRFYAPDNAVVVVAGRFDEAAALDVIARSLRRRSRRRPAAARGVSPPEHAPAAEVRADRRASGARRPRRASASPRRAWATPTAPPTRSSTEILAGGPSSRLQRELVVEKELASSVHGDVAPTQRSGPLRASGSR